MEKIQTYGFQLGTPVGKLRVQIKIQSKRHIDETPTVYLDGIKVEVLYDTDLLHMHPDFARDTILKDETFDGIRVVTIVAHQVRRSTRRWRSETPRKTHRR